MSMNEDVCRVSMWLRPDPLETFDLKFLVQEGRGILRISRPGILLDQPARNDGLVKGLSLADLHATRFLLLPHRLPEFSLLLCLLSSNSWPSHV